MSFKSPYYPGFSPSTTVEAILAKWKSEDERKKSHYEEWVASLKRQVPGPISNERGDEM